MSITISTALADEFETYARFDARNFGIEAAAEKAMEANKRWIDFDRSVVAHDGDRLIGFLATRPSQLSVPGGALIPTRSVGWASVAPSHTRLGVLSDMLAAADQHVAALGEPVLSLQASMGGIYERFGYGSSTSVRVLELSPRRARIRDAYAVDRSLVTIGDLSWRAQRKQFQLDTFATHQRHQVGETSLDPATLEVFLVEARPSEIYAEHPEGFAVWTVDYHWNEGHSRHLIQVHMLVANTAEAHVALWSTIMASDLVETVRTRRVIGPDDPLADLLTNPRELRTLECNDGLWLKVTDPVAAFGARSYRVDDELVISVTDDGQGFTAGANGSTVTDAPPDLRVSRSALGPLLVGSRSATSLAAARRITAEPEALSRADALFGHAPRAHTQIPF